MGFSEIFFLGLDLKLRKGKTHFFGFDFASRSHEETEFPKMRKMFTHAADVLKQAPVEVYSCSPVSTIEGLPKVSYEFATSL
jgi:hypothetical protein